MQKLIAVEEAKALMQEATNWSLWGWLTEKRKLRTTADAAWEALEEMERKVKRGWSSELKQRMKEADAEWRSAREKAEATFDEAERRMSTSMACEGARQAIAAWELMEHAIRRAEALSRRADKVL